MNEDADTPVQARLRNMQYAESNRNLSVGIGGTCVAILTFVLFFLFAGAESHQFSEVLFQLTLATIILALFLFAYSGACYFTLIALLSAESPKAPAMDRSAYLFFVGGIVLLTLEPALILFTVQLWAVAILAAGLWVLFMVLLGYSWRVWAELLRGKDAVNPVVKDG